jgi:phage shock protein PspC (stress-responsive transcriptional regulator)
MSQAVHTHKQGWSKRERELVRLWVAQISINRHRHQLASDSYSTLSFRLQLVAIIITTTGAVFSFMSSYFNNDPEVVRILTIIAGILALISALFAGIFATISPDTNSEKHRQTGIHYANYSNEIQAVLVEENDEHMPQASEFLARIRNGIHLLQSFGPSLDETADSDLPSSFLLRDYDGYKNSTAPQTKALVPGATLPSLPTGYDMFKRDDEPVASATARAERRRAALEQLRKDREEIAARKQQIIEEEQDIQNAMQSSTMLNTLKSKSNATLATQSTPAMSSNIQPVTAPASAPNLHTTKPVQIDNIVNESDGSVEEDTLAHGSDTDAHHRSAVAVMRSAIGNTVDEQAARMRSELRQRYKSLKLAKEQLVDVEIAYEKRTSEVESDEQVTKREPTPPLHSSGVIGKIKSVLKKSLSPQPMPVPSTEQEIINMQTQKVKELGFSPEELV